MNPETPADGTAGARLAALGLSLPEVAKPLAAYAPAIGAGGLVYTAGQLPSVQGMLSVTGKVGGQVSAEVGAEQARICAMNAIAAAAAEAGGLEEILRVIKLVVFVASTPDFTGQPAVADGASRLLAEVFGEDGTHVRSAVGVASLPLDAPVEVELTVQVRPRPTFTPLGNAPLQATKPREA